MIGDSELESFLARITTGLKALASKDKETAHDLAVLRMGNEGRLIALRETILGGALTSDQVAERLGRTRPTVHATVKGGLLLAVRNGRALRFPVWQIVNHRCWRDDFDDELWRSHVDLAGRRLLARYQCVGNDR